MRTTLAFVVTCSFLFAANLHARKGGDSLELLASSIQAADWHEGAGTCAQLAVTESRLHGRGDLPASRYAILAVRCAAIAASAGDLATSEWWWYSSLAMDSQAAAAEAANLAAVAAFHPAAPRPPTPPAAQLDGTHVTLPDGSVVIGTAPRRLGPKKPPHYMFEPVPGVAGYEVDVETIVGADGVLHKPLLVSAHALPVQAFLTFASLREWRYEPSRVDQQPVDTRLVVHLTSTFTAASSSPRPRR